MCSRSAPSSDKWASSVETRHGGAPSHDDEVRYSLAPPMVSLSYFLQNLLPHLLSSLSFTVNIFHLAQMTATFSKQEGSYQQTLPVNWVANIQQGRRSLRKATAAVWRGQRSEKTTIASGELVLNAVMMKQRWGQSVQMMMMINDRKTCSSCWFVLNLVQIKLMSFFSQRCLNPLKYNQTGVFVVQNLNSQQVFNVETIFSDFSGNTKLILRTECQQQKHKHTIAPSPSEP